MSPALPRKLKQFHFFANGIFLSETAEVTLPKLALKTEEIRNGGMLGPILAGLGMEAIETEWKLSGISRDVLGQWGVTRHDGLQLRFLGAYQDDGTGTAVQIEVLIRGRHTEMDHGTAKAGDDTEVSIKTACSYYKLTWNGATVHEIDLLGMVMVIGGVDRMAEVRAALLS